jgi:L-threonylcarbamoyladenylate synthase
MVSKGIKKILLNDGVGILPTDTIYGLVGLAFSKKAVERIYKLRRRNPKKPMIILISSFKDLDLFNIKIDYQFKKLLNKFWPGKVSIVLPCRSKKFVYLHRGTKTLAFRWPKKRDLINLIKKIGPLVAPSANPEGKPPAKTIEEARKYFKNKADFYIDAGEIRGLPSALIQIKNNDIILKRKGGIKLKDLKGRLLT